MKIKAIITVTVASILLSLNAWAQDEASGGSLTVGANLGMSNGYIKPGHGKIYDFRAGFRAGVFGEYRVMDFLSVGTGANIHFAGSNNVNTAQIYFDREPITSEAENFNLRFTKIEIPLYAAVFFGNIKGYAGGSWNHITNVEADFSDALGDDAGDPDDVTARFARDEFSLFIGAGYNLSLFGLSVCPQVQYNFGITDKNIVVRKSSIYHDFFSVGVNIGLNLL